MIEKQAIEATAETEKDKGEAPEEVNIVLDERRIERGDDDTRRSTADDAGVVDASMSPAKNDVELEDMSVPGRDIRLPSPVRTPATKRVVEHEDENMSVTIENKSRKLEVQVDSSMDSLTPEDRRIASLAILGVDVTELFSPERVASVAAKFGLVQGSSFYLTNGWDFCKPEHRAKAFEQIRREKPFCVIGSPPCTKFSLSQELTKARKWNDAAWMAKHERELAEAVKHI